MTDSASDWFHQRLILLATNSTSDWLHQWLTPPVTDSTSDWFHQRLILCHGFHLTSERSELWSLRKCWWNSQHSLYPNLLFYSFICSFIYSQLSYLYSRHPKPEVWWNSMNQLVRGTHWTLRMPLGLGPKIFTPTSQTSHYLLQWLTFKGGCMWHVSMFKSTPKFICYTGVSNNHH